MSDKKEIISIIAHTVMDIAGLITITVLMCLDKLSVEIGVGVICAILGLWGFKAKNGGMKTPPTGVIVGLGGLLANGLVRGGSGILKSIVSILFIFIFMGCASSNQGVDKATKVLNGFVEIHDKVQTQVNDTQRFCADTYKKLKDHPILLDKLESFCDRADLLFDDLREIEKKILGE